jgi:hypothetical protein
MFRSAAIGGTPKLAFAVAITVDRDGDPAIFLCLLKRFNGTRILNCLELDEAECGRTPGNAG